MITGPIRQDGPIDHIVKKSGTPTMGGVIIIIGIILSTILWQIYKYLCLDLNICIIEFRRFRTLDDILKIKLKIQAD